MKPNRHNFWIWILAAAALVPLVLGLTWLLQDIARSLIVVPASYVIWLFGLFIESTPQIFFWIALLVFAGALMGKSFSGRPPVLNDQPVPKQQGTRRSRLGFWLVQLNYRSEISRGRLAESVDRLAIEVLSATYHIPAWQVEKKIMDGEIPAPAELLDYLNARKQMLSFHTNTPLRMIQRAFTRLKTLLMKTSSSTKGVSLETTPLEQELEGILKFLEDQMEIHHDTESF